MGVPARRQRRAAASRSCRGEREIEQAIQIILMTYPGERPMRPRFGCPLRDFVFRNADYSTAVELSLAVKNSVAQWEPRVDVVDVVVRPDPIVRNRLDVEVIYTIKHTNDRAQPGVPLLHDPRGRERVLMRTSATSTESKARR